MKLSHAGARTLVLGAIVSLVSAAGALADKPFPLRVGSNDTLYVYDQQGNVVSTLPAGTIAKQIDIGSYSFQVSYGRDASGNLSVIVTPNPENPTPLDFTLNGHEINVSSTGVATLTVSNNGQVRIEGGELGGVTVDGHSTTTQMAAAPAPLPAGAPGVAGAAPAPSNSSSTQGAPAAQAATATQIATPDSILATFAPSPNVLPGPTNQQPDVFPSVVPTYGAEGEDPTLPPAATLPTTDVRTNPQAIINGSTGQPIQVGTGPSPTTPI